MGREMCFHLKLRQADRMLTSHYDSYLRDLGIKVTQFSILRCLHFFPEHSHKSLEKKLILNQTTLTRNLKSLVKSGYIQSKPSNSDQRVKLLSLSLEGEALYTQAVERWEQAQKSVSQKLGTELTKQLFSVSDSLVSLGFDGIKKAT